jgi:ubiquinone/menaquinone biosynthesis C-methylase UbiE
MQESTTLAFDEETYLACNPDVQLAVANGQFTSGFDHFLKFGRRENRRGVTVDPLSGHGAAPHPPEHLRLRVHGGRDLDGYLQLGQIISQDINHLLQAQAISVPADARVLDFGSGPGRVATWLKAQHANWEISGTDIDAEAIAWARANLANIATFECNQPMPPLHYPDEHFDFTYSISIFTHLPEEMQNAWLQELARVTKRGGYLALTTHSEKLLPPSVTMSTDGFYYSVGTGTDGLPGFYQTSFQTSDYIRRVWSKFFGIERIIPRGLAKHQDLVVCHNER